MPGLVSEPFSCVKLVDTAPVKGLVAVAGKR
jgi:hypothetical protein